MTPQKELDEEKPRPVPSSDSDSILNFMNDAEPKLVHDTKAVTTVIKGGEFIPPTKFARQCD